MWYITLCIVSLTSGLCATLDKSPVTTLSRCIDVVTAAKIGGAPQVSTQVTANSVTSVDTQSVGSGAFVLYCSSTPPPGVAASAPN